MRTDRSAGAAFSTRAESTIQECAGWSSLRSSTLGAARRRITSASGSASTKRQPWPSWVSVLTRQSCSGRRRMRRIARGGACARFEAAPAAQFSPEGIHPATLTERLMVSRLSWERLVRRNRWPAFPGKLATFVWGCCIASVVRAASTGSRRREEGHVCGCGEFGCPRESSAHASCVRHRLGAPIRHGDAARRDFPRDPFSHSLNSSSAAAHVR
jgi:hypothetical protein